MILSPEGVAQVFTLALSQKADTEKLKIYAAF
jgi:hypothetical protein